MRRSQRFGRADRRRILRLLDFRFASRAWWNASKCLPALLQDFEAWADYLGDPPLAMAFLDRIVDGAIILKFSGRSGRSYRAHRAKQTRPDKQKPDDK